MAIYLGVTIIESVRLATVSKDARILPRLPAVFWTIHVGSGCGLLWEMARRN
jgi:hypothetical protein